jgi:hypothetical protein
MYFNLDYCENKSGPFETRKVTLKEQAWVVDYGASYTFGPWHFGKSSKLELAPYAGSRHLNDNIKIEFKPGPTVSDTINFNTSIIGLRALWYSTIPGTSISSAITAVSMWMAWIKPGRIWPGSATSSTNSK